MHPTIETGQRQATRYLPFVDGLRAVAVLCVVLFHVFDVPGGGYVGVDVFFVISGFLITGIIVRECAEDRFTFRGFYDRRIRRILPALIPVWLFSVAAGYGTLLPSEFADFGRSLVASATFVANIFFWSQVSYFQNNGPTPLLHLWSLAIEEQFYIFWPVVLLLLHRAGRARYCLPLAIVSLVLSLVLAEWTLARHASASFYLLPTRAWELMVGAAIALAPWRLSSVRLLPSLLGAAGLVLILVSAAFYTEQTPFPGVAAILPCLGTGLVILSGRWNSTVVTRLLGSPPFLFFGRISYSLYLWHWPVLTFAIFYLNHRLSLGEAAAVVAACVLLATLSLHFVEQPFRHHVTGSGRVAAERRALLAGGGVIAAACCAGLALSLVHGMPGRVAPDVLASMSATERSPFMRTCLDQGGSSPRLDPACLRGTAPGAGTPTAVLWGDSHAGALAETFGEVGRTDGLAFTMFAKANCPPLLDVAVTHPGGGLTPGCTEYNRKVMTWMSSLPKPPALVVLAGRWASYSEPPYPPFDKLGADPEIAKGLRDQVEASPADNQDVLVRSLRRTVEALRRTGTAVLIVGPVPDMPTSPGVCMARELMHDRPTADCQSIPASWGTMRDGFSDKLLPKLAQDYPGTTVILPDQVLCTADRCDAVRDGRILYEDNNHLNDTGGALLLPMARKAVAETLARP